MNDGKYGHLDNDKRDENGGLGWAQTHTDRSVYQDIKQRAHIMRQNPTAAEDSLWQRVRRRQICGCQFRRQHVVGRFIVDFFCAEARLVIEVDGSVHNEPDQEEYDRQRQSFLEELGLRVLRFKNEDVLCRTDLVLFQIAEALRR